MSGNFTKVPNEYIRDPQITSAEFRVLVSILSYGYGNNPSFPSQNIVSQDIGLSTRAIRYSLKSLSKKGYISYKRRGFNKSNVYDFLRVGKDISPITGNPFPPNKTNNKTNNNIYKEVDVKAKMAGMTVIKDILERKNLLK